MTMGNMTHGSPLLLSVSVYAEIAVVARYPSLREVPRLGRLVPRRYANRSSIITDLGPGLPYLLHRWDTCSPDRHDDAKQCVFGV
jgi:hypothetical protein